MRRGTLQVALLDAYRKPYAGFEGVIAVHMKAKWTRAIATAKAWAEDAKYVEQNIYIIFSVWREICTLMNEKLHTEA